MPQVICTFLSAETWQEFGNADSVRSGTALVFMSAGGCDQTVEGFDLPVEHFDVFLLSAPGAFRYRLASLYRLVKLIEVGTTNLVGLLRLRPTLTCICPANEGA
jgi:hypothetical protein